MFFSREFTKNPNDPTLSTLREKYYKESWGHARSARIKAECVELIGKDDALKSEAVKISITAKEELLNANASIMRHIATAQSLQLLATDMLGKFHEAIPLVDIKEMASADPKGFIGAMKIVTDFLNIAIDIERKAVGMAGLKVEFVAIAESDREIMDRKLQALRELPTDELIRNYIEGTKD
jgi:hypothetical protein